MSLTNQQTMQLSGDILDIRGIVKIIQLSLGNHDEEPSPLALAATLDVVLKRLDALDVSVQYFGFGSPRLEAVQ